MRKIIAVVVCLLLLTPLPVPASAEGLLSVSISNERGAAYRGDILSFDITISGDGTCNAFGCFLVYDSAVLEYLEGSAYVDGAVLSSMDSDGLVVSYGSPATPSGTVASFTMRVKDDAPYGDTSVMVDSYTDTAALGSADVSVAIVCSHSYSDWQQYDENCHQKTCSICGGTAEEDHNWNAGIVVSAPTCGKEGSKTYTCVTCGAMKDEIMDPTDDHQYSGFQMVDEDLHRSTCDLCGTPLTASHTWDAGTIVKPDTCKDSGILKFTCTDCGHTKEESFEFSAAHTYGPWSRLDGAQHTRSCTGCGASQTEAHSWNDQDTCPDCKAAKTGKQPVSSTPTEASGKESEDDISDAVPAVSHSYGEGWKQDSTGHWRECVSCGEKTDAADHLWDEGVKAEMGKLFTCTVCAYQRFETANLTPIFIGAGAVAVAAAVSAVAAVVLKRRRK